MISFQKFFNKISASKTETKASFRDSSKEEELMAEDLDTIVGGCNWGTSKVNEYEHQ